MTQGLPLCITVSNASRRESQCRPKSSKSNLLVRPVILLNVLLLWQSQLTKREFLPRWDTAVANLEYVREIQVKRDRRQRAIGISPAAFLSRRQKSCEEEKRRARVSRHIPKNAKNRTKNKVPSAHTSCCCLCLDCSHRVASLGRLCALCEFDHEEDEV